MCNVTSSQYKYSQLVHGKLEVKAISSASNPPLIWMRNVDDTFVVIDKDRAQEFGSPHQDYR